MAIRDALLALIASLPAAASAQLDTQAAPPPKPAASAATPAPTPPAMAATPVAAPAAGAAAAGTAGERTLHGVTIHEPVGDLREECASRRRALAAALGGGGPGVVWIEAPDGANLERFFQDDDVYYLTGLELPDIEIALVIDEHGALADEVLFLPAHDDNFEVWNGKRLSPGPEAEAATGFRHTALMTPRAPEPGSPPVPPAVGDEGKLLASWAPKTIWTKGPVRTAMPAGATVNDSHAADALAALRLRKSPYEIGCLKAAIDITCASLYEAAAQVGPGAFEYQPWGALEGSFLKLGSERPGFASIFGSGPNSCSLHYNADKRQMQDGELIVMDVGAKYRYYCADVTRTVPVNGKFTPRQRQVYDLVLKAQTTAFQAAKPGITMHELDGIARKVIDEGGFGPGRKYFKHGLGHWIGLDVHDVGVYGPIQPGMLFTIEPGIYIAEENLGVRIEDDYLMTEHGAVKLSDGITSDPDAIEALLRR